MWRIFFITLFIGQLFGNLKHGRLSIIPEYDRNAVTVLISGHKVEATQSMMISLPTDVDSVSLIQSEANGDLSFQALPIISENNQKWVKTPTDKSDFAIMILTVPFKGPGHRHFDYDIQFSSLVESIDIEVQEPMAATSFKLKGIQGDPIQDPHGQTTHQTQLSQLNPDSKISIQLEYENPQGKTTRELLQEMMNMSQNAPTNRQPPQEIKRHKLYVWEPLIAVGVLTVLVIIFMKMNQTTSQNSITCNNCGQRLKSSDNFCSTCGDKK